jgi:hypothetical protein
MVSGEVKLDPDAGERGFGTATAANAVETPIRIRANESRKLTTRVFMIGSSKFFKGTGDHLARDGMIQPKYPDC